MWINLCRSLSSVADPGFLSWVRISPSRVQGRNGTGPQTQADPQQRISVPFLTQKWLLSSRNYDPVCLSRIRIFSSRIPKPDSGSRSWIQGSKKHWIPNPGTWFATLPLTMCYDRFTLNLCLDLKLTSTLLEIRGRLPLTSFAKGVAAFPLSPLPPSDYSYYHPGCKL